MLYNTQTILLFSLIVISILGIAAQIKVGSNFKKYSFQPSSRGISAHIVAENLLFKHNIYAQVIPVSGNLTDHFNPKTMQVGLSESVYNSSSVAALAVAAHEIGHVIQYNENYVPIKIRNTILPVAQLGSTIAPYIILFGIIIGALNIAMAGIILFGALLLFQLITLPVEFNASKRAINMLVSGGYIAEQERPAARKMLNAAALTYVISALAALITFIRFLTLVNGRRRN